MPAQLVTPVCLIVILYLLWTDIREDHQTSHALWIPLFWMFLAGSRFASQWLNLGASPGPMDIYQEGSTVDSLIFALLMMAGTAILLQRRLDWSAILTENKWLWLYFLFCAVSITWSDDSIVSMKRWIKAIGDVIMVLVILTEEHPYEAVVTVLRRLAIVILPLSVLFIKYYPELGRMYHMGSPLYTGVATHKSGLGQICMITGIGFLWSLLYRWREEMEKGGLPRVFVNVLLLLVIAWLFYMADSATSLTCLLVVMGFFLVGKVPAVAGRPVTFIWSGVILVALLGVMDFTLGISDAIIALLGRSRDLTTRVPMWEMLLNMDTNPLIGVGYESFWFGERLSRLWAKFPFIQAHNGYLELYLNVGLVGLSFMLLTIANGFVRTIPRLEYDYANSLLRIAFVVVCVLYNWTEAAIKPVSNVFIILLLGIMVISHPSETDSDGAYVGSHE